MFISHERRAVFVRVPKTGSTTVVTNYRSIRPWSDWDQETHVFPYENPVTEERYADYEWWSAVRDPYTWIPSFYQWLARKPDRFNIRYMKDGTIYEDWEKFIRNIRYTPCDWAVSDVVKVNVYKLEEPQVIADVFGVDMDRKQNITKERREFEPTPAVDRLIQDVFHRELEYYR